MFRRAATWIGASLGVIATLATASAPRSVLLLHSFGPDFSPYDDCTAKLRGDLARQSSEPIHRYEVSLATARFAENERDHPVHRHAGMRQRAMLLGGRVEIDSRPGRGTTIRGWVPFEEQEEHGEPPARAAG
jgi:hypothetical protein